MHLQPRVVCLLRLLAFLLITGMAATPARAEPPPHVPGEVLVGFRLQASSEQIKAFEIAHNLTLLNDFGAIRARHY